MDSSLLFNDGNVIEFFGNTSSDLNFQKIEYGEAKWDAAKYGSPAYIGRVATMKDGFFRGTLMNLCRINSVINCGQGDVEDPIIGRFFRGRNDNIHVIFYVIKVFCSRCWIKKKIDKQNYGVISAGKSSNEAWNSDCISDGYFSFYAKEFYTTGDKDKKAATDIVTAEYERLLEHCKNFKNKADEFVDRFEEIKEDMFDLLDKFEDIDKHEISYI